MRSLLLVATAAVLIAAESVPATPTPAVMPAPASVAGLKSVLTKNGNVRYGPSTQAKVVVTLSAGQEVELLGPAQAKDWFVIRFPQSGKAWVHRKVLQSVDGGKRWQVIEDKARARDDATLGAVVVAELGKGEVLEDKGQTVGDWQAVTLPNAVAYLHRSVLSLPTDLAGAVAVSKEKAAAAASAWTSAQTTYAAYYEAAKASPEKALALDWAGLGKYLDHVIADHPDVATRMAATRLKDGISNVNIASLAVHKEQGTTPPTAVDPLAPKLLTLPGATTVEPGKPLPAPTMVVPAKAWVSEGLLNQRATPAHSSDYALINGDGDVVALLKGKVGADVPFSEYYWRWVGVRGETTMVDLDGKKVPVIMVEELGLSSR